MDTTLIKVLFIDDDPVQARVIKNQLSSAADVRFELDWAGSLAEGLERLGCGSPEVLLLDLGLAECSGPETFHRVHARFPDLAVVVFTGLEDEAMGLQLVQAGAQDYLIKGKVSAPLLCRTLRYALERKHAALERERLIAQLQEALANIKTLSGLVPICASCKQIRDDRGYWKQVETYVAEHSQARFSHGICPDCLRKLYPDYNPEESTAQEGHGNIPCR